MGKSACIKLQLNKFKLRQVLKNAEGKQKISSEMNLGRKLLASLIAACAVLRWTQAHPKQ